MKLYIKQKVFSWTDKFTVTDENNVPVYTVAGKFFSVGKQLYVYDAAGTEVAQIKQKVLSFMQRFFVTQADGKEYDVQQKFSFLKPKFQINGLEWRIEGDFWAHNYYVMNGDAVVLAVHKKWMSWGDSYELDINSGVDPVTALSIALVLDCVAANQEAAND